MSFQAVQRGELIALPVGAIPGSTGLAKDEEIFPGFSYPVLTGIGAQFNSAVALTGRNQPDINARTFPDRDASIDTVLRNNLQASKVAAPFIIGAVIIGAIIFQVVK